jgi:GTP cyclohydrolase I
MSDSPADHVRALLESIGLEASTDAELEQTPERFVELLETVFDGVGDAPPAMSTFTAEHAGAEGNSEPVVLTGLPFYSMCVHHLVPFFGAVDVAYVPDRQMTGFGSVGRVIDHFSKRPQIQERLVDQIAGHLDDELSPQGILVRSRARQMCMEMRGAEKRGHLVATASRGSLTDGKARSRLLDTFAHEQDEP